MPLSNLIRDTTLDVVHNLLFFRSVIKCSLTLLLTNSRVVCKLA